MSISKAVTMAPTQLYLEGNGRLTCETLACAGMAAHFSGMTIDLNGATIEKLTPSAALEFKRVTGVWPACESCGAEATRLA